MPQAKAAPSLRPLRELPYISEVNRIIFFSQDFFSASNSQILSHQIQKWFYRTFSKRHQIKSFIITVKMRYNRYQTDQVCLNETKKPYLTGFTTQPGTYGYQVSHCGWFRQEGLQNGALTEQISNLKSFDLGA